MSFNHLDFNVSVISDGRPLPKYDTKLVHGSVTTCYILSEVGKEFSVRIDHSTGLAIRASLRMDGRSMEKQLFDSHDSECIFRGVWTSPTTFLPFMFRRIEVEDTDRDQTEPDNLGIIEVDIQVVRVNSEHASEWSERADDRNAVHIPVPVPERIKKDGHHLTQLGRPRECDGVHYGLVSDQGIDPVGPRLIFQFRYLPLHLLQAHGIVAHPTPSSEPHSATGSAMRTEGIQNSSSTRQRRRKTPPPPIEDIDPRASKRTRFSTIFPDVALSIASNLRSIPAFRRICTPYGLFLGQETGASSFTRASARPRVQRDLVDTRAKATRIRVLKRTIDAAQAELRDLQTIDLTSDEDSD